MQDPQRRVLVAVDMENYSRRNNVLQYRAQQVFRQVMDDATAELGLHRVDWILQQGGDGELAILPPGASERVVAAALAPVVDRLLRDRNQGLEPEAKVRLRLAVHQGLVHLDGANGFPSEAVVHVCRLVDSAQAKEALRDCPGADVVLVVSDSVYREVVEHYRDLRPDQFAEVRAEVPGKGFSAPAWIFVPGENIAGGRRRPEPAPSPATAPAPAPAPAPATIPAGQTFSGITTHGPAQFGNHNTMRNDHG